MEKESNGIFGAQDPIVICNKKMVKKGGIFVVVRLNMVVEVVNVAHLKNISDYLNRKVPVVQGNIIDVHENFVLEKVVENKVVLEIILV